MDTVSDDPIACAAAADIVARKLTARAFERELRTEAARWAWSVAVWELTHPPPDPFEHDDARPRVLVFVPHEHAS